MRITCDRDLLSLVEQQCLGGNVLLHDHLHFFHGTIDAGHWMVPILLEPPDQEPNVLLAEQAILVRLAHHFACRPAISHSHYDPSVLTSQTFDSLRGIVQERDSGDYFYVSLFALDFQVFASLNK